MQRYWGITTLFFLAFSLHNHVYAENKHSDQRLVGSKDQKQRKKRSKASKNPSKKPSLRPSWRKMWPQTGQRQAKHAKNHVGTLAMTNTQVGLPANLPPREDATYPTKSLDAVFKLIKRSNLDLRILRQRIVQVELARAKSWAILKPQLSLGASFTRTNNETTIGNLVIAPQNRLAVNLQMKWAFLNLSAIPILQMSYLSLKQVGHTAKQIQRDILYGSVRAYYGVLLADGLMNIAKQTWNNAKEHLRISIARYKAGVAPELIVTRAKLDIAKAWQSWIQAQNGLRNARLALALMLNRPSFLFKAKRPTPPKLPAGKRLDWRNIALRNRSEIKAKRIAVQIAQKAITQQWMKYLPTVAAIGQVQGSNATGFTNQNYTWSVTIAAQMNLYSGGVRSLQVKEAYSKLLQARLELAKAIRKVDNELSQTSVTINNAKIAKLVSHKQLRLAQRTYQLTQERYKTGVATSVEVSDALTVLQSTKIAVLRAELSYELAILQLQRTLGLFRP